jgi:predicted dienelactone hydrolase
MNTILRRCLGAAAGIAVGAITQGCNPPNYPTGAIEQKYYAAGTWAVSVQTGAVCCDSSGNKFDLYYPTNLGAGGFKHPILTWGNGTDGKPSNYDLLLRHMASWGFAVIATQDKNTGVGKTILDAANVLINANSDPMSIFHNKLDVNQIGAIGHSQGAAGAINALMLSGGTIKTVVPIELPARQFCISPTNCTDTSLLVGGSIFFVDGSLDIPISPPTQPATTTGEQSIEAFYNAVPAGILKLKGTLLGPTHNDVTGQPDCKKAQQPCLFGVYGYLG